MDFLAFRDGFKALVIRARESLMLIAPRSFEQEMIIITDINDIKSSLARIGPIVRSSLI